jgi:hypothetical protein
VSTKYRCHRLCHLQMSLASGWRGAFGVRAIALDQTVPAADHDEDYPGSAGRPVALRMDRRRLAGGSHIAAPASPVASRSSAVPARAASPKQRRGTGTIRADQRRDSPYRCGSHLRVGSNGQRIGFFFARV